MQAFSLCVPINSSSYHVGAPRYILYLGHLMVLLYPLAPHLFMYSPFGKMTNDDPFRRFRRTNRRTGPVASFVPYFSPGRARAGQSVGVSCEQGDRGDRGLPFL